MSPSDDPDELITLARALVEVGRDVRRGVGEHRGDADAEIVRNAGGDDVFGVDARADEVLLESLERRCGARWSGTLVIEGFDDVLTVGDGRGPWRFIADPVDGSRPWLWGKRSAYVLLGAGREAEVLDDLEVGACVELPTSRAALSLTAAAVRDHGVEACDDIVAVGGVGRPVELEPLDGELQDHSFVTVASLAVGTLGRLGAWQDAVLDGLHVYDDNYISSGGLLVEVACGRQAAVLDPRPSLSDSMVAHPYDLAAWLVAAEAGAVVESLDGSPLRVPLDTSTPVAWAAYANDDIAAELRARIAAVGLP